MKGRKPLLANSAIWNGVSATVYLTGGTKLKFSEKELSASSLVYGPRSEPALSGISRFLGAQLRATTLKIMQVSTPEQIPLPGSQRRWKMKLVHGRDFKAFKLLFAFFSTSFS